jgi:hypothetical protein
MPYLRKSTIALEFRITARERAFRKIVNSLATRAAV